MSDGTRRKRNPEDKAVPSTDDESQDNGRRYCEDSTHFVTPQCDWNAGAVQASASAKSGGQKDLTSRIATLCSKGEQIDVIKVSLKTLQKSHLFTYLLTHCGRQLTKIAAYYMDSVKGKPGHGKWPVFLHASVTYFN